MIEVLKQALEALEFFSDTSNSPMDKAMSEDAITSLRQAIAELEREKEIHDRHCNQGEWKGVCKYSDSNCPTIAELESQEPVSTLWQHGETGRFRVTTPDSITDCDARWFKIGDLYIHPPQRTWQGLTDEEIASVANNNHPLNGIRSYARAIEAKLKQKNGFAEEKNT